MWSSERDALALEYRAAWKDLDARAWSKKAMELVRAAATQLVVERRAAGGARVGAPAAPPDGRARAGPGASCSRTPSRRRSTSSAEHVGLAPEGCEAKIRFLEPSSPSLEHPLRSQ